MSTPEPMDCLRDECPSPLHCNSEGRCQARADDSLGSWDLGIRESRERGVKDPFKQKEQT